MVATLYTAADRWASAAGRTLVRMTAQQARSTAPRGVLLLREMPELRFGARIFEEAGDAGSGGRLEHAHGLGLLVVDQEVFADVEVGLTLALTLDLRVGILGGIDDGLGRGLAEQEVDHGARPLIEIELGGAGREHLLVRVACPSLRQVESDDAIGLGGIELHCPDEVRHGRDVQALVEACEAAIVEGEGVVGIDLDRLAVV